MKDQITAAITIGDPNGIGPEIILKTFKDERLLSEITPIIYSPIEVLDFYIKNLNLKTKLNKISKAQDAADNKLNVLSFNCPEMLISPGNITKQGGEIAFQSLKKATADLLHLNADIIVTAPINKDNIQNKEFNFLGHTEYFTEKCNQNESLMLMAHHNLKIGLVTNHLPIEKISENIHESQILNKLLLMHQALKKDFAKSNPKIALMGLNPHSGDNGLIGNEEKLIIKPTILAAKKMNINVSGPFPADGFFANKNHKKFDGILAMYHDQGLIPFKILSNNEGVNFTAGLPIIRTSPDHGTGYDIAGKSIAKEESFKNALLMAKSIYKKRNF
ncbi:MAG: 4-hydroxythreonine-4-phosphate dehydrogenase PdxA [Parvicellaceae bacterium]